MHCQCGQVWDAGDDRPACLDFLYHQLKAAEVGERFSTDATRAEVLKVWGDRIDLYGMRVKVHAVEQGYSVVSVELEPRYEISPPDWVWFGVAAYFAVLCLGAYVGATLN
jgi:hypothetical protein